MPLGHTSAERTERDDRTPWDDPARETDGAMEQLLHSQHMHRRQTTIGEMFSRRQSTGAIPTPVPQAPCVNLRMQDDSGAPDTERPTCSGTQERETLPSAEVPLRTRGDDVIRHDACVPVDDVVPGDLRPAHEPLRNDDAQTHQTRMGTDALLALVREEGLTQLSDILVSARGSLLPSISANQALIVNEAIDPITQLIASDVGDEVSWVALIVLMQSMLSAHDLNDTKLAHAHRRARDTITLRDRVRMFHNGSIRRLWDHAHIRNIRLPTTATWEKTQLQTLHTKRTAIAKQVAAALDDCDGKRGSTILAGVPTAPPGEREYGILRGLIPQGEGEPRNIMTRRYEQLGYDQPRRRAAELHARLAPRQAMIANTTKWLPRMAAAKVRKAPDGTAIAAGHTKRLAELNPTAWAVIFEAIECRALPERVRILMTSPFVQQLLKRDKDRRYSRLSSTRPIGLTMSMTQDALRSRAKRTSNVLACVLVHYGQMSVGTAAGGESAQGAAQARCDMSKYTVTVAIDLANAFGLVGNEVTLLSLYVVMALIRTDRRIHVLLAKAGITVDEAIEDVQYAADDLVYTRTHGFNYISVVEGVIRRLYSAMGETQGGLFSALRFTAAKAISVDEPLGREFPQFILRSIVDDGISQTEVRTRAQADQLTKWMWRLDELVRGHERPAAVVDGVAMPVTGRLGRLNFSKFKILQHSDMRGTEADIEPLCTEMPFEEIADEHGEIRKAYPTVVRHIIEFNGIAVGFDTAARQAHVLHEVQLLEERVAPLLDVAAAIGRQRAEMY